MVRRLEQDVGSNWLESRRVELRKIRIFQCTAIERSGSMGQIGRLFAVGRIGNVAVAVVAIYCSIVVVEFTHSRVRCNMNRSYHWIAFVTLALAHSAPNAASAFTIHVEVFSLRDELLSRSGNRRIQEALRNNPVRVTVFDVSGAIPIPVNPAIDGLPINPDGFDVIIPDAPISVRLVFSCPGLKTATLDGVYNVNQTVRIVMPEDASCQPTAAHYSATQPCQLRVKRCWLRRR